MFSQLNGNDGMFFSVNMKVMIARSQKNPQMTVSITVSWKHSVKSTSSWLPLVRLLCKDKGDHLDQPLEKTSLPKDETLDSRACPNNPWTTEGGRRSNERASGLTRVWQLSSSHGRSLYTATLRPREESWYRPLPWAESNWASYSPPTGGGTK